MNMVVLPCLAVGNTSSSISAQDLSSAAFQWSQPSWLCSLSRFQPADSNHMEKYTEVPPTKLVLLLGVFDSCKIVVWQTYRVGALCVAISVWQNRVLSGSRFLSAKAKCWDLLSQTTGMFSSLLPWLPKWEWDSSADSRRLGCGVVLYFGLLTVSLTQYPASLDFFATPEDSKALKARRGSISVGPWFSLLFWQAGRMIRESMGRSDDGISFSTSPPSQGGCGTNVLVAHAHFVPAMRGDLGLEVQLWKKHQVKYGEDATWPYHSTHQINS